MSYSNYRHGYLLPCSSKPTHPNAFQQLIKVLEGFFLYFFFSFFFFLFSLKPVVLINYRVGGCERYIVALKQC